MIFATQANCCYGWQNDNNCFLASRLLHGIVNMNIFTSPKQFYITWIIIFNPKFIGKAIQFQENCIKEASVENSIKPQKSLTLVVNYSITKESKPLRENKVQLHKQCTVEMGLGGDGSTRGRSLEIKPALLSNHIKKQTVSLLQILKEKELIMNSLFLDLRIALGLESLPKSGPHNFSLSSNGFTPGFFLFSKRCGGQKGYCHVHCRAKFTTHRFSRVQFQASIKFFFTCCLWIFIMKLIIWRRGISVYVYFGDRQIFKVGNFSD